VKIGYRTPFQRLPAESDVLRYQRALVGGKENLPYQPVDEVALA